MPTHIDMKAVLFIAALISVSACAAMKDLGQSLDGGGIEQVEGEYYYELKYMFQSRTAHRWKGKSPTQVRVDLADNRYFRSQPKYNTGARGRAAAYYYCLDTPRFIRYIHLDTVDPIKNLYIYIWEGEDWKTVKKMKKPVEAATRIDINRRTEAIRVVQSTVELKRNSQDHVTDFDVYVQKK